MLQERPLGPLVLPTWASETFKSHIEYTAHIILKQDICIFTSSSYNQLIISSTLRKYLRHHLLQLLDWSSVIVIISASMSSHNHLSLWYWPRGRWFVDQRVQNHYTGNLFDRFSKFGPKSTKALHRKQS